MEHLPVSAAAPVVAAIYAAITPTMFLLKDVDVTASPAIYQLITVSVCVAVIAVMPVHFYSRHQRKLAKVRKSNTTVEDKDS